jgi:hypothetical protein
MTVGSTSVIGDVDVRETMRVLPTFVQGFLTWLTGKPLKGQKPSILRGNLSHIFTGYALLLFGLVVSVFVVNNSGAAPLLLLLLPIGWVSVVSAARKIIPTLNHHAVHYDLLPDWLNVKYKKYNRHLGQLNSSIFFLQSFDEYLKEHSAHHNVFTTATMVDGDMQFLWLLGFRPNMPLKDLYRNFYFMLFFPFSKLHTLFIWARFKTNFGKVSVRRRFAAAFFLLLPILAGLKLGFWAVCLAWVFPMTYLYHIASLMQFTSEHLWLKGASGMGKLEIPKQEAIIRSRKLTVARFCGEAYPDMANKSAFVRLFSGVKWWFRMLTVHLFARLYVVPGDLPQHDLHHRSGVGIDWANSAYVRQSVVENLRPDEEPFMEVWGYAAALRLVLSNFSSLPPIAHLEIDLEPAMVLGM